MMALKHSPILRTIPFLIATCHCERSAAIKGRVLVATAVLLLNLVALPVQAKYSGGSGTAADPYQIATAADLIALGETPADYDKHFILTADIDLDPNLPGRKVFDKAVIAPDTNPNDMHSDFQGTPFGGVFDGNGHAISHLTIKGGGWLGLFGTLDGKITKLGVVDVNIIGSGNNVGGLVGENDGIVTQGYSTGVVRSTGERSPVGGLVGLNWGGVTQCYSTAAVRGCCAVGGLVGQNWGATVTQCYSTGAVRGTTGPWVGGLVGLNWGTGSTYMEPEEGVVTASFWDTQTSGQATSDAGIGKTTAEMQTASTFWDAGWDFVGETENGTSEIWQMPQGGGYPVLAISNGYTPPRLRGRGTGEDPYLISDALELGAMVHYSPDAHYRLTASINLSGIRWGMAVIPLFAGTFDGNGNTISHLTTRGGGGLGLFGGLQYGAVVKDLGVVDVNIAGSGGYIGGLAGSSGGTVTQCYSTGVVRSTGGWSWVAGLVGFNGGTVTRCYSTAAVRGRYAVGGLVGSNDGTVTQSCSTGVVTGTDMHAGGLVGLNWGDLTQCYSAGAVSGMWCVGGLVGCSAEGRSVTQCYSTGMVSGRFRVAGLVGDNNGTVIQCYSTSAVKGGSPVGGLVGLNRGSFVTDCFWDTQTSSQATSAGGTGKTTAEMQMAKTFLDAGWDFVGETKNGTEDIWKIAEGLGYPRLSWEKYSGGTGEPNDPYRIATAADLILLGETPADYDKHFLLTADIDLDPNLPGRKVFDKAVIAPDTNPKKVDFQGIPFIGVFDGNGHTISHLTLKGEGYLGLFGQLGSGAELTDLGIVDVNIAGSGDCVGGLAGHNNGTVINCYSTGVVRGRSEVGGLVGWNTGTIVNSYSAGSVAGTGAIGGLAGKNGYWTSGNGPRPYYGGVISKCYSVSAVASGGGLVGSDYGGRAGVVNSCFWDNQTSGQTTSAGGTGETTAGMQTAKTFLDAGWDFVGETKNGTADLWWILEGKDYPRLWWEAAKK